MLNTGELLHLCETLGLSPHARMMIDEIRSSPPTRRVRSATGNVSVRYPSRKMGVTIQAESHRNELAGVYEKEHDPATLEYYDQPPPIKLVYPAKSGRRVGVLHTPDYFVIESTAVGWEEWKTEGELHRLAVAMPHRYQRGDDDRWQCPPGEQYAAPFGFFYRVRSSAEIDWVFQRNLLFLEDYLRNDCPPISGTAAATVRAVVVHQPGLPLAALLDQLVDMHRDVIYTLIATEQLTVDLHAAALAEPERVRVFPDRETARVTTVLAGTTAPVVGPGASVEWAGRRWTVVSVGETTLSLQTEEGVFAVLPRATINGLIESGPLHGGATASAARLSTDAQERLGRASPEDFREANRRYAIIAPRLVGAASGEGMAPVRTVRLWLAQWRDAERIDGCGYSGLLPRRGARGNRTPKLPEATRALLDRFIRCDYETIKQKPKVAVYAALVRACEAQGCIAPSYKTFVHAVAQRPRVEQIRARQGARAAYQTSAFYWELTLTTPRHGDRPFEIGHIDHTQLDVELVCARTGRPLGRPWATFLTDAFSRRILAISLTFDAPSYRSCMMVLRECVRRYHRLPQTVVVDGGPEFASVYFETLLARYECTKKTRPMAQPRFGSVCERLFGTTNTQFVHTLAGNTQLRRNVRQVTKSVDPKEHACWTLDHLAVRLDEWAEEIYETIEHPALGTSPRDAFATGMAQSGHRPHRVIPFDDDFRMLTLPTTRKGTATVHPRRGVTINAIAYWCETFVDATIEQTAVPVRFDPFDAGVAYAFVKDRWVRCISEYHAQFAGRSEREIRLATSELRRRQQQHARQAPVTAQKLAAFLASVEAEELLLEQRLRDAAAKDIARRGAWEPLAVHAPLASRPAEPSAPGGDAIREEDSLVIYGDY